MAKKKTSKTRSFKPVASRNRLKKAGKAGPAPKKRQRKAGRAGPAPRRGKSKKSTLVAAPVAKPPDRRRQADIEKARAFAIEAARMLGDDRCEDIVVFETGDANQLCDFVVLGTGSSDRQMRGTADDVEDMGKTMGFPAVRRNLDDRTTWVLMDFVDVIIHLFEPNARAFYDLDMMWGDSPRVEWKRPAGVLPPGRARRPRSAAPTGATAQDDSEV